MTAAPIRERDRGVPSAYSWRAPIERRRLCCDAAMSLSAPGGPSRIRDGTRARTRSRRGRLDPAPAATKPGSQLGRPALAPRCRTWSERTSRHPGRHSAAEAGAGTSCPERECAPPPRSAREPEPPLERLGRHRAGLAGHATSLAAQPTKTDRCAARSEAAPDRHVPNRTEL